LQIAKKLTKEYTYRKREGSCPELNNQLNNLANLPNKKELEKSIQRKKTNATKQQIVLNIYKLICKMLKFEQN